MTTWETSLVALLVGILSSVITSAIKNTGSKAYMKEAIEQHIKQHHQAEIYTVVKAEIQEHADHCQVGSIKEDVKQINITLTAVKSALVYLVGKTQGNPKELGLV